MKPHNESHQPPEGEELGSEESGVENRDSMEESSEAESETPEPTIEELKFKLRQNELEMAKLKAQLTDYQSKISQIRDYVKKMESEIQEIKERSQRNSNKIVDQKLSDFFKALLPVIDNFELSLRSADQEPTPLAEGVRLIYQDFQNFLKSNGLEKVEGVGREFNPQIHDAVCTRISDEDGKVLEELKTGYLYKDQVLRPAQVIVGASGE